MKMLPCNKYLDRQKRFLVVIFIFLIIFGADQAFSGGKLSKAFPPGEGSDTVTRNCAACHSSEIVLQNSMTREGWDETITVMQKEHGLWYLGLETRNQILNYLSTVRGIKKKGSGEKNYKTYRYEYKPNPLQ